MVEHIDRDELRTKIDRGDPFVLLEVLAPRYYRHSHLPGALNLPPGKATEMAPDLLPNKEAEIVLYCWDAAWRTSLRAARELAVMGYTNVREYSEGKRAWIAAGLPVEGRSRRPRQRGWWKRTAWSLLSTPLSSARAPRGRVSRCSRSLHLDARPEGGATVELSVSSTGCGLSEVSP